MSVAWFAGIFLGGVAAGALGAICLRRRRKARGVAPWGVSSGDSAPCPPWLDPVSEVIPEAFFILDCRDRLVFANAAARERFSFGDAQLGLDAAILVRSADFIARLRTVREPDAEAPLGGQEIVLRRGPREGERIYAMRAGLLPPSAGFGEGAMAVSLVDLTRVRHLERLRREFVANVSHDLRTPVTILKGYAQALCEDFAVMDDGNRLRFLEKIRRNVERLHALLESMVELAAADEGAALSLKAGAVNGVLRDAVDTMADRLAERGLSVEFECLANDSLVEVDPMRFSRIIINVLENVLRYAHGAKRVRLRTLCDAEGFHVRVEDDGPGLASAAEYERVFERFFRVEKSRSPVHGGSGLGLAIVKNMVLSHGGTVRAEPVIPRGFAVVITLPLLSPAAGG